MTRSLGVSSSAIQLSMTTFLLGLVLGQLLLGPISDSRGRRGLLLGGSAAFALLSLVCAVAPNAEILTAARLLQGLAGAAGMVIARAVITDVFEGPAAARSFSILSMITGVAPVAAPVLGGVIVGVAPWRAVFVVLAVLGVVLFGAVARWVPETLPPERRIPGGVGQSFRSMRGLLTRRTFMGFVLVLAAASAALFAYIAGSSFVFQDIYGVSAITYSLIFATNAAGLLIAAGIFGSLSRRVPLDVLLGVGVGIGLLGVVAQVVVDVTAGPALVTTWVCLFVTMLGLGFVFTSTMTLGQAAARHAPGGASALLGGGQFLLGAIVSPVVGAFGTASPLPMAVIMLCGFVASGIALVGLVRPWRGSGAPG